MFHMEHSRNFCPGSAVRTLVITPPFRESWLRIMLFT